MGAQGLPKKMKAIQVQEFNKPYKVTTVPVPSIDPTDLLIKVGVASYCHTDSMVSAGTFGSKLPVTASHEGSGTVVAIGSDVHGFKEGDRVMCGIPLHPCGSCGDCLGPENQTQYCTNVEGMVGVHLDGCFAEYVRVDSRNATPLPDEVSLLSAAPLACAGRTVWRGVIQTGLKAGEWIAIVGAGGGLGHLGIQFAKALGLKVIAIDAQDKGLEISKHYGADVIADARQGKDAVIKVVHGVTNSQGADSTINLSDNSTAAGLACAVTKMHGTMIQIAQPDEVSVPFTELIFRDVRIHGSLVSSAEESKTMLDIIAKHGVKAKTNAFYGLDKIGDLVDMVHDGKILGKAVIVVDPEQLEAEKQLGAVY